MSQDDFDTNWHALVGNRLTEGDERMARLEARLAENTRITKSIEENTQIIIEWAHAADGARKVLEGIGRLARPIGYILTAIAGGFAVYTAAKTALAAFFR